MEFLNETFLTIFKHCEQSSNNTEHKKRDPHYVNTFVYIFQVLQPSSSDIAALRPKIGIELDSGLRFPDWQYNYRNSSQKKEENSQCQWQCVCYYTKISLFQRCKTTVVLFILIINYTHPIIILIFLSINCCYYIREPHIVSIYN